jgi:hypothetical protein
MISSFYGKVKSSLRLTNKQLHVPAALPVGKEPPVPIR